MRRFRNREEAGRLLAEELVGFVDETPVVLALPRGGVPVAFEIARALDAPLDVWIVRKIGVPWHPELGVGAVAEGGHVHINRRVMERSGISDADLASAIATKREEVEERVARFRGLRAPPDLTGKTVVLVDDGIATGGTVEAAIRSIRDQKPRSIVLAVPVAALQSLDALTPQVDDVVCLMAPRDLFAIGLWYDDFEQVPDDVVIDLLERARAPDLGSVGPESMHP